MQLANHSPQNVAKYKAFKQIYFKTLRAAKTLYFRQKLRDNVKNPKKTWNLLKEATVGTKHCPKIEKIVVDGKQITDAPSISDEFNKFFTSIK